EEKEGWSGREIKWLSSLSLFPSATPSLCPPVSLIHMEYATTPAKEMTNAEKAAVRTTIFQHLAGIVLVPVVKALAERGVFAMLADAPAGIGFDEIADQTHGNRGYLRVALRLLVSCGWMAETGDSKYALTAEGKIAVWLAPIFSEAVSFIPKAIFLDDF